MVTSAGDAGTGTFRDAIDQANGDSSVTRVKFQNIGTVQLISTVEYTGKQSLRIDGKGTVIQQDEGNPNPPDYLLASSGGANLVLKRLTIQDGANGIVVWVPADADHDVSVTLVDMTVRDNDLFGLFVADLSQANVGIDLDISFSSFTGNGTGELDFAGVWVEESGPGSIVTVVRNSQFDQNGGDGMKLWERGVGNVDLTVRQSTFNDNGLFDKEDLNDGLDIDESDSGDVDAQLTMVEAKGNGKVGIQVEQGGAGTGLLRLQHVTFGGNGDGPLNASGVNVLMK